MENETRSSNRTLLVVLAIAAVGLVVAAGIIFAALVLRDGAEEGAEIAGSAKLMPDDTLGYVVFNPHLDQAKNFEVIEKAWGDNPVVKQGLTEMLNALKKEGLDYKSEIEPWLGDEVAFGMGAGFLTAMEDDIGRTFEEIEEALSGGAIQPPVDAITQVPQFVIIVATKDKAASDTFLDKLRAEAEQEGNDWQETEYKGVSIVHSEQDPGMAYATVGDYVVLAVGGLEPIQAVIDAQDGNNLKDNETYNDVMAKLPADQVGYGYIDMSAYMDAVLEAAGPELSDIPPELFTPEQLDAFKAAGFSVGFEPNGLRIDSVAVYDKDAMPDSMLMSQAIENKAAERVPDNTLFYVSGGGLGDLIQMLLDAVQAMPDQPEDMDEQLQMLTAMLGVSVDDLIEMLSGEFAVAVTHEPAGIGGDPSVPIGASFLLEAQDEAKFQSLFNSVSALLALGAEMELPKETIDGVEVTMISDPASGNLIAGWGVGKGFFALATSERLLEAAFGGDGEMLADAATFKAAVAPLPKERSGIFFMNMAGLLEMISQVADPSERDSFMEAQPLLESIKALSAGAEPYNKDKDSVSGTFFILIEGD